MKFTKYLLLVFPLAALIAGCDKHDLGYADSDLVGDRAMFQISYVAPKANNAANAMDSIYVNNKLVAGVTGSGRLLTTGQPLPYGASNYTGHYFVANAGSTNIKFYKNDNVVYDRDVVLSEGRQKVFVYSLDQDPIVIKDIYPNEVTSGIPETDTFDSDSLCTIRFFNFFFENPTTPYAGKLQYQWSNNSDRKCIKGDWHNVGEPVGFGEATEHCAVVVHKTVYNSAGYQEMWFRCIDEDGNMLKPDYWTFYIGRRYNHILRWCRTGTPAGAYQQCNDYAQ